MVNLPARNSILFDSPANYQIIVQGKLTLGWLDRLDGMTICPATVEADPPITILEGELSDQAALAGVLNTLYELQLTVVSVNRQNA